jgi:UDP-N-acetylmuramate-alanine ligase
MIRRAEMLAELMRLKFGIAVATNDVVVVFP